MPHLPVLLDKVLNLLDPKPGEDFIDCTVGGGGHAREILDRTAPSGRLLGIDLSGEAIERLKKEFAPYGNRVMIIQSNYRNLKTTAYDHEFLKPAGVLMDLGISSEEFANAKLGLSFQLDGPLDMRLGGEGAAAAEIVNSWSESELARLIRHFGEERYVIQIARAIIAARKKKRILGTTELADIIRAAVPKNYERGRIHPATRTFQALRIAVNNELENLEIALPQAVELLESGGRLAVISFHSLEDRIVKRFFREEAGRTLRILTKRPVQAGEEEVRQNPRARSAKLRAAEKL